MRVSPGSEQEQNGVGGGGDSDCNYNPIEFTSLRSIHAPFVQTRVKLQLHGTVFADGFS